MSKTLFYAMELELRENKNDLIYEQKHNLSRMPLKIDFLVIKKKADAIIKNEIGDFFLGNNIFEYKSPKDDVNAGTFFKALSYAYLYNAEENQVEDILKADTTILLVRENKPEKLLNQLKKLYRVTKEAAGIYRINGMLFPMQIIVTKELDKKLHIWVTSLTRSLSAEQVRKLLGSYTTLDDETDMKNADSIVNVASQANIELFKKMIQEGDQMCEELKELLAPEIVEFKIRLEEQNAQLADKDAEIAKLKKMLKEAGIEV